MLKKSLILLMVCLVLNLGACSVNLKPRISETGVDICKTDVKVFQLEDKELDALEMNTAKNAALINCILAECGATIPNREKCKND